LALHGLTSQQPGTLLHQYGENCLPKLPKLSFLTLFIAQFKSAFIYVLLAAFLMCLLLGQFINALFIFAVLRLNALIGTVQEHSAQQAADALSQMVPQQSRVIHDGHPQIINSTDLVPGDWIMLTNGDKYHVAGTGLASTGLMHKHGDGVPVSVANAPLLYQLGLTGVLANEAHLAFDGDEIHSDGDGVDLAFLSLGYKLALPMQVSTFPLQEQLFPYESGNQFNASINKIDDQLVISVKGAVEKLLTMCSLSETQIAQIHHEIHWMARHGYRVLALASGHPDESDNPFTGLTFLGLAAMSDPLREDAIEAVNLCQKAKIKVAMITGDHPVTALALSQQLKRVSDKMMSSLARPLTKHNSRELKSSMP
jgi:magnesium-transporting ATPase (P-type)